MSRNIYLVLGKKCGHTHAYEINFDIANFYRTSGDLPLKIKEVELRNKKDKPITRVFFDECVEPAPTKEKLNG